MEAVGSQTVCIPDVALMEVFKRLDDKSKGVACQVCRLWKDLVIYVEQENRIAGLRAYLPVFLLGDWPKLSGVSFSSQKKQLSEIKAAIKEVQTLHGMKSGAAIRDDVRGAFLSIDPQVLDRLSAEATRTACFVERVRALQEVKRKIDAANEIADDTRKSYALSEIVKELAEIDIQWALDVTRPIPDKRWEYSFALSVVAKRLAAAEGRIGEALQILKEAPSNGYYTTQTQGEIVRLLVDKGDMGEARRIASAIDNPYEKTQALVFLVKKFIKMPDTKQATQVASEIPNKGEQADSFFVVIRKLVEMEKIPEALEVADEALKAAQTIREKDLKARVFCRIAHERAEMGDIDRALSIAISIVDESWRTIAFSSIAKILAKESDVDSILRVTDSISNVEYKAELLSLVAQKLTEMKDKKKAYQIASFIPSRPLRVEVSLRIFLGHF